MSEVARLLSKLGVKCLAQGHIGVGVFLLFIQSIGALDKSVR